MSLRKVYGGTPVGSESRCDSCLHARIIQGYSESERIVMCGRFEQPLRIDFKVAHCSEYEDRRLPELWEMRQIAWELRTKSAGKTTGFVTIVPPAEENDE